MNKIKLQEESFALASLRHETNTLYLVVFALPCQQGNTDIVSCPTAIFSVCDFRHLWPITSYVQQPLNLFNIRRQRALAGPIKMKWRKGILVRKGLVNTMSCSYATGTKRRLTNHDIPVSKFNGRFGTSEWQRFFYEQSFKRLNLQTEDRLLNYIKSGLVELSGI